LTRPCRGAKPAGFIRDLDDEIVHLCAQVLFIRNAQGLIGREMSAIDGVKLPSNASKQRSGTRAEFARQAAKLEAQGQDAGTPSRQRRVRRREARREIP
jgi:hypothetical protein